MGYSQGNGIAGALAERRPVAGVVVVAPYDRMTLIGVKQSLLFAPRWESRSAVVRQQQLDRYWRLSETPRA
jgi:pimeloyl-ACP methyl ester carboxylesterase